MERIKSWFKGDPVLSTVREFDEQQNKEYSQKLATLPSQKFDARILKLFGNRYSPETYERVLKYFPSVVDSSSSRTSKLSELVTKWPRAAEVFYQRYGSAILGASVSLSAFYITAYFRNYFRLQHYARASMYITALYFPSISAGLFNELYISPYLIKNGDSCIMCLSVKNALVQTFASVAYPLTFSAGMGMFYSTKYLTYKFPFDVLASKSSTKLAFKIIWQVMNYRRAFFLNSLCLIMALNCVMGYYITEQEQKEIYAIYQSCLEHEEELIKKGLPSRPPFISSMITSKH